MTEHMVDLLSRFGKQFVDCGHVVPVDQLV